MPKRRVKRNKDPWPKDERIKLLGILDMTVQAHGQQLVNKTLKEKILNMIQLHFQDCSIEKISSKLRREWQAYRDPNSNSTFDDIYRSGTACMTRLDDDTRFFVRSTKEAVQVSTPRKTRYSSQNLGVESERFKREQTIPSDRTPTTQLRNPTRRTPQRRTPQIIASQTRIRLRRPSLRISKSAEDDSSLEQHEPERQDNANITSPTTFYSRLTTPLTTSIAETVDISKTSEVFEAHIDTSHTLTQISSEVTGLQPTLQSTFFTEVIEDVPKFDYDEPNSIRQLPDAASFNHSYDVLRNMLHDITFFRERYLALEKKDKGDLRTERLLHSLLSRSDNVETASLMIDKTDQQDKEIANLKRLLDYDKKLQRFQELGKFKKAPANLLAIQQCLLQLKKGLNSLSMMDSFQHPSDDAMCIDSEDLSVLKHRISINTTEKVTPSRLVQSLTGTAVCDWVFMGKFQCFAMMETPLLAAYRDLINAEYGDEALRDFDFAAHQSVIDSEYFREGFLPGIAANLAERLIKALHPMINDERVDESKALLKSVFEAALEIKYLGMVGQNMYEIVWPAYHSVFEPRYMQEDLSQGFSGGHDLSEKRVIKVILPLVPGLLVYDYERKLVDYRGFTLGEAEIEMRGSRKLSLVAHAVVMVK